MRRPAAAALRFRRALRATVHAAARRTSHAAEALPAVAHIVADLDDIESTSDVASALAWRRRTQVPA